MEVFSPCTKCPKYKPVVTLALLVQYASTSNLCRLLLCSYLFITDIAKGEKEGKQEYAVFADRKWKSRLISLARNIQEIRWQVRKLVWHMPVFKST